MTRTERPGADGAADPVHFALTGAGGGFGRTLLAQARSVPGLEPAALCDVDADAVRTLWSELGLPAGRLRRAGTAREVRQARRDGAVALVTDAALLPEARWDILVEATGNPAAGHAAAARAVADGRHVAMASKEVDSVAGTALARAAAERGVVYTPAGGDQPANLLGLYAWGRRIGLDIVAMGKSSEYDLVFDPATGTVTQNGTACPAPGLGDLLTPGADLRAALDARAALVEALPRRSSADHCEMAVVSTGSGFRPDVPDLHYPVARPNELADVYALREHGGILGEPGTLDVFSALRLPGEASFAGGVFLVVRTGDGPTWEMLRAKGHVVSRDGRYACVYLPYHLMGVETPFTLFEAVRGHRSAAPQTPRQHTVLAARATRDLEPGAELRMHGHHHEIDGLRTVLLPARDAAPDTAPFYLAAGARTARAVPAGRTLRLADLDGHDPQLSAAWDGRVLPA